MADKIRRVTMRVDPYERLGELVRAARLAMTDPETRKSYAATRAADAAGMDRNTWGRVEREHRRASDTTYAQLERFFDWVPGSILRYLDADGPEPGRLIVREVPGGGLAAVYPNLSAEDLARVEDLARRLARGERP